MSWEKIREHIGYRRKRALIEKTFRAPNGKEHLFDVFEAPDVVIIVPQTKQGKYILVKQFRPGPERQLLEWPAGKIEDENDALETARRELLEETGCDGELTFVGSFPRHSYMTGTVYVFSAINCEEKAAQELDDGEDIEVLYLDTEELARTLPSMMLHMQGAFWLCKTAEDEDL